MTALVYDPNSPEAATGHTIGAELMFGFIDGRRCAKETAAEFASSVKDCAECLQDGSMSMEAFNSHVYGLFEEALNLHGVTSIEWEDEA